MSNNTPTSTNTAPTTSNNPPLLVPSQVKPRRRRKAKNKNSQSKKCSENHINGNPLTSSSSCSKKNGSPSTPEDAINVKNKQKSVMDDSKEQVKEASTAGKAERKNQKKKRRNRKSRQNKSSCSWQNKHLIPAGEVDPISLEPLEQLNYPPFVLSAGSGPNFELIRFPTASDNKDGITVEEVNKNWHLFDGRVLAYYLVSQMQFIDPLNRRDLSREELIHLDKYLKEYNLIPSASSRKAKLQSRDNKKDISIVVNAFDSNLRERGHINSAGQAAQTERARAEALQREATDILNALFGQRRANTNNSLSRNSRQERSNSDRNSQSLHLSNFMDEFERDHREDEVRVRNQIAAEQSRTGTESHGMIVIDDDLNPGLRGQLTTSLSRPTVTPPVNNYTENLPTMNNLDPYVTTEANHAFPPLESSSVARSTATTTSGTRIQKRAPTNIPVSNSLRKISKLVKPTNLSKQEKMKKAREAALERAAVSQMTFEEYQNFEKMQTAVTSNLSEDQKLNTRVHPMHPTKPMIERNILLANALGVKSEVENREKFMTELIQETYQESLIREAKENIGLILKLEKRWIAFMKDNYAKSYQCNSMSRSLRKLVHEYSDFWYFKTESFDPEPKRYVNCVKTVDSRVPKPLLSAVARNFRGTKPPDAFKAIDNSKFSSNEQNFNLPDDNQERPKLKLSPRTLPLELPPFKTEKEKQEDELIKRVKEKEQEEMAIKEEQRMVHQTVFDAFADTDSDDASSVWTEKEAPSFSDGEELQSP